jgi:hypothetical protein
MYSLCHLEREMLAQYAKFPLLYEYMKQNLVMLMIYLAGIAGYCC